MKRQEVSLVFLEKLPFWLGLLAALIGTSGLLGWALDLALLKSVVPGSVAMKANTAVGLILSGFVIFLISFHPSKGYASSARTLSCAVVLLGAATLCQYLFGRQLGIDELLFEDPVGLYSSSPGRMSPLSAVSFICVGIGLFAITMGGFEWLTFVTAFIVVGVGAISGLGYLWNATELISDAWLPPVAINTAIAFTALGVSMLLRLRQERVEVRPLARSQSGIETKILAGFSISFLLLMLAGGLTYHTGQQIFESAESVSRTQRKLSALQELYGTVFNLESAQRSYLITEEEELLDEYFVLLKREQSQMDSLSKLIQDTHDQSGLFAELRKRIDTTTELLGQGIALYQARGFAAARDFVANLEETRQMRAVNDLIARMAGLEASRLEDYQKDFIHARQGTLVLLLLTAIAGFTVMVLLYSGITDELTRRQEAEKAMGGAAAQLEAIFNTVADGLITIDRQGVIRRINPAGTRMFDHDEAFLVGKSLKTLVPVRYQGQIDGLLEDFDSDLRASDDSVRRLELEGWRKDGSIFPVDLAIGEMKLNDDAAFSCLVRDITKRKQAEAERDRYFTLSLDLLCVAGFDGYFKRLNPAWTSVTGWTLQELLHKPIMEFVHPEDREATIREIQNQQRGEPVRVFKNRYCCKDGAYRWLSWKSIPVVQDSLMYGVARDITERLKQEEELKTLNEQMRQRSEELDASNKELEAFTYSVSHDLRAPLRHIDGFSKLLMDGYSANLPEEARDYVATIRESTREMSELVDDLLNLARIGRRELSMQVAGLSTVVDGVISNLKLEVNGREIVWDVKPLPFAECDPTLMKQVFANLLSNAVKFTRNRKPAVIEIGAIQKDSDSVIYVRDNGAGFDMKYVDKLFGVFQRLHRQEDFEGTGIGLAIVARVIKKHGGRVWAEGELNKGASFYFTLGTGTAQEINA